MYNFLHDERASVTSRTVPTRCVVTTPPGRRDVANARSSRCEIARDEERVDGSSIVADAMRSYRSRRGLRDRRAQASCARPSTPRACGRCPLPTVASRRRGGLLGEIPDSSGWSST